MRIGTLIFVGYSVTQRVLFFGYFIDWYYFIFNMNLSEAVSSFTTTLSIKYIWL